MTLLPGDVILTGTPEGVGPMQVGDEVEVSIEGLGSLTNTVAPAMTPDRPPSRVRMAPSPTGSPHVGLARTALFNWAFARHHGGTFVFRIEDTDHARNTEESYDGLIEVMQWLGLDWDEGPVKGGDYGPYRQSERTDIYRDVLARLRGTRFTYDCYCTTDEVDGAAQGVRLQGDGLRRLLPRAVRRAGGGVRGRGPQARRPLPDARRRSLTWDDLVRGEITFETEFVPDFALCRANGDPLYTLVNPVDDALMEITHVLRGEDLLSSTPRQLALYEALTELGIAKAVPRFGHLPYVMGEGNKKLRQARPQGAPDRLPRRGLPARGSAQLPGPARLGDRRRPRRVHPRRDGGGVRDRGRQPQPGPLRREEGRRDQRAPTCGCCRSRRSPSGCCRSSRPPACSRDLVPDATQLLDQAMPLVAERINKLTEAVPMLGFLFVDEDAFAARRREIDEPGREVVRAAHDAVAGLAEWSTAAIQEALQAELVERARAQAAGRVRAGAGRRHRSPGVAPAVRVAGAARSRAQSRPPAERR